MANPTVYKNLFTMENLMRYIPSSKKYIWYMDATTKSYYVYRIIPQEIKQEPANNYTLTHTWTLNTNRTSLPSCWRLCPPTHHSSGEGKELVIHISLHLVLFIHCSPLLRPKLGDDCYELVEVTAEFNIRISYSATLSNAAAIMNTETNFEVHNFF